MTTVRQLQTKDIPGQPFWTGRSDGPEFEILTISELRDRFETSQFDRPNQYGFNLTIIVSEGQTTQIVDFEPVSCAAGTVLSIQSGQTHVIGNDNAWNGWLIFFKPEFLPSSLTTCPKMASLARMEPLPPKQQFSLSKLSVLTGMAQQMQSDSCLDLPHDIRETLLRHQLCVFLIKLLTLGENVVSSPETVTKAHVRIAHLETLINSNHTRWHNVAAYARAMGCSEKSLSRAAREVRDTTPKAMISARQVLEAKRLLAHSQDSVTAIGRHLGFNDPTNFIKFFRRETETTPAEFRRGLKTQS